MYGDDKPRKHKDPHPYSVEFREFESAASYEILTGITGFWSRLETGPLLSNAVWPPTGKWRPTAPVLEAEDQFKLLARLKEKIRGSEFNMAVTLGEGREALEMIGNAAIRLRAAVKYARKGNFVAAIQTMSRSAKDAKQNRTLLPKRLNVTNLRRQTSDQLSSNWLELQYGWLPLLSDIHAGAKMLAHNLLVPRQKRYTASVRRNSDNTTGTRLLVGAEDYAYTSRRIIAYVSEQPESIPRMLGLLDPELVAWELTPFSFVADWFLPIGDYLEARAFSAGLTGTFVETTKVVERMVGVQGRSYDFSPGHVAFSVVNVDGPFVDSYVSINRTVSTSLSVPLPAVKPLSEALSWKRTVNAISLLAQTLKTGLTWEAPRKKRLF